MRSTSTSGAMRWLLFVVAFYVYPMKFLFSVFVNAVTGYQELDAAGAGSSR